MRALFGALGCVERTNLAAFDLASNQVTSWNHAVQGTAVNAVTVISNQVFVGGIFTNIAGQVRTNLAALDPVTGAALNWAPNPNSTVSSLATWSSRLFVGGFFTRINGLGRSNTVEYDLGNGLPTTWDPGRSAIRSIPGDEQQYAYVGKGLSAWFSRDFPGQGIAAFDLTSVIR